MPKLQRTALTLAVFAALSAEPYAADSGSVINEDKTFAENSTIVITGEAVENDANRHAGIAADANNVTVTVADGATLTVTNKDAGLSGVNRWYGIASSEGASVTVKGNTVFDLQGEPGTIPRGLRAMGGDITLVGDTTITLSGTTDVWGVEVWEGADVSLQGNTNISVTAMTGGDAKANAYGIVVGNNATATLHGNADIRVIGGGERVVIGAATEPAEVNARLEFNGSSTFIRAESVGPRVIGVRNYNAQDSVINFHSTATTIEVCNAKASGALSQGVLANHSTTNFHGNVTLRVEGGVGMTSGVHLEASEATTLDTILNLNGRESTITVNGEKTVYGILASGNKVRLTAAEGGSLSVSTTSADEETVGLDVGYGAKVEVLGNLTISAASSGKGDDAGAYGIRNQAYAENGAKRQFGTTEVLGDASITAQGQNAYGIRTESASFPAGINPEGRGTFLRGHTTVTVRSTEAGGEAVGISSDNTAGEVQPTTETSVHDLTVDVSAVEGSDSIGILGTNRGILSISGNAAVNAQGKDAVGLQLENSSLTLTGSAEITGEGLGVGMAAGSDLLLGVGAALTTNSMKSDSATTLETGSTLAITGARDAVSTLGTIEATTATVALGAGGYEVTSFTGDGNRLLFTDLGHTDEVTIGEKSGALDLVASPESNDAFANAEEAAIALTEKFSVTDDKDKDKNTVTVEAGLVNDRLTADLTEDGELENVRVTKNERLDAFGSVAALSALQLRHETTTLTRRMGELRDSPSSLGLWARAYGSESVFGAQDVEQKSTSLQMGADRRIADWTVGAALSVTEGESRYEDGRADQSGVGAALYATRFFPCGAYLDLMGKVNRIENDFDLQGLSGDFTQYALGVTAETGYRFEPAAGLYVEPMVGVAFAHLPSETVDTSYGVSMKLDSYRSLTARSGLRTGFVFPKNAGSVYAHVSGVYEFEGEIDGKASYGSARNTIREDLGGASVEFGIGADFRWSESTRTFVALERSNAGDVKENWRWNVGLRTVF